MNNSWTGRISDQKTLPNVYCYQTYFLALQIISVQAPGLKKFSVHNPHSGLAEFKDTTVKSGFLKPDLPSTANARIPSARTVRGPDRPAVKIPS
ncbi:hypothetical protein [Geothermobacter hydrogeniphilus]|uniref:hypothetical protein n=1 Tax=Geothermobacter hydrogeniphilus TaxID=1969733 RepID=UPI00111C440C|nr:hypothetical protein [Geothermobacter hydrogeniphilus]